MADLNRLKQATDGTVIAYGGVRIARSLLRLDLVDKLHLYVCPIALGEGQPLFTELKHRQKLRLSNTTRYESGATMMHYDLPRAA